MFNQFCENHRFHLHGSFIFQIIFVACWVCAYLYMVNLHRLYDSIGTLSTYDYSGAQANVTFYGYGFVILNIIQATFIMCYHCLQNERVSIFLCILIGFSLECYQEMKKKLVEAFNFILVSDENGIFNGLLSYS